MERKRKRKILKKSDQCLRNTWAGNRSTCTHTVGVPEEKRERRGREDVRRNDGRKSLKFDK